MNRPALPFETQAQHALSTGNLALAVDMLDQARARNQEYHAACHLAGEVVSRFPANALALLGLALDRGADPDFVLSDGMGLLEKLASNSSMGDESSELAALLLDRGASLEIEYDDEDDAPVSVLMRAAAQNAEELVELLIARGAGLEVFDSSLETALFHAVRASSIDAVRVLLEKGAHPDGKNASEATPLFVLFAEGEFGDEQDYERAGMIAHLLIEAGASIEPSCDGLSVRQLLRENFEDTVADEVIRAFESKAAEERAVLLDAQTPSASGPGTRRSL